MHNTICLGKEEIIFRVKHYESVFHLITVIPEYFETSVNDNFVRSLSNYIHKYEGLNKGLFKSYHEENSIMFKENLVSYFPSPASIVSMI